MERKVKLRDDLEVGMIECPICKAKLRVIHRRPTKGKVTDKDPHKLETIRD